MNKTKDKKMKGVVNHSSIRVSSIKDRVGLKAKKMNDDCYELNFDYSPEEKVFKEKCKISSFPFVSCEMKNEMDDFLKEIGYDELWTFEIEFYDKENDFVMK